MVSLLEIWTTGKREYEDTEARIFIAGEILHNQPRTRHNKDMFLKNAGYEIVLQWHMGRHEDCKDIAEDSKPMRIWRATRYQNMVRGRGQRRGTYGCANSSGKEREGALAWLTWLQTEGKKNCMWHSPCSSTNFLMTRCISRLSNRTAELKKTILQEGRSYLQLFDP